MSSIGNIFRKMRDMYAYRYGPESVHVLGRLYWRALLALSLIAIVAIFAFGVWEFFAVMKNLGAANAGGTIPPSVLDRAKLDQLTRSFEERKAQYDTAAAQRPSAADPSVR